LGKIFPKMKQIDYARIVFAVEKILSKVPIIRWLGDHWLIILKKL
jgi:hypothetical protein